ATTSTNGSPTIDFYDAVESPDQFDQIDRQVEAKSEQLRQQVADIKAKMVQNAQRCARIRTKLSQLKRQSGDSVCNQSDSVSVLSESQSSIFSAKSSSSV